MEQPLFPCCVCGVETETDGYTFFMDKDDKVLSICESHFNELVQQIDDLRRN